MSKENSNPITTPPPAANNGNMGLFGDMSMLRDIIMGPKVVEYEQKFADTDALIQKNDDTTKALIQKTSDEIYARIQKNNEDTLALIQKNEEATQARFDRLEQLLNQNVEKINAQMRQMSKSDKAGLSDLLVELSKKLKE